MTSKNATTELVIIRGIPGSGKSILAKKDYPGHVLVEADMFRYDKNGQYLSDTKHLIFAHMRCFEKVQKTLAAGQSVVISNTFIRRTEMAKYIKLGFPFRIVHAKGAFSNIHGVPADVVERMRSTMEPITDSWLAKMQTYATYLAR